MEKEQTRRYVRGESVIERNRQQKYAQQIIGVLFIAEEYVGMFGQSADFQIEVSANISDALTSSNHSRIIRRNINSIRSTIRDRIEEKILNHQY